jgi:hypothetical protein
MCNRNQRENIIENSDVFFDVLQESQLINEENFEIIEIIEDNETIEIDLSSFELSEINKANLFIRPSDDNRFIGYIELNSLNPDIKIGGVYIYERYIVLEEFFQSRNQWFVGGFNVYEYVEDIKINEYKIIGNLIYSCTGDPFWFQGIYNDYLFIDIGTGPGIRGVQVIDLNNNEILLSAGYENWFWFQDNIVGGLVMNERSVRNFDENIQTIFLNYMENATLPEETHGLFPLFVIEYRYNIITNEIEIRSGRYTLEQ